MDPRRALSFGPMATADDRGRPTYPVEAVRWALPAAAGRVLDLAAGTGKLSAVLLQLGLDAVAVEPDGAMRALVPTEALVGTAEQIPLPDASMDAVLVGQALHHVDTELLMDNLRSRSTFILMAPSEREALLERAREVVPSASCAVPYVCTAWRVTRTCALFGPWHR